MQIKGIDVSHWQGNIDWSKVAKDDVKFAFLKASEGTSNVDKMFKTNAARASAAGIHLGAYHYAKFSNVIEAKEEAEHFLKTVAGVKLTYPLVLDLEENKKGASRKTLTDAAIVFLQALESAGYWAMLYTGKSFLETKLEESRLKSYGLWVARYNSTLGRSADIWQYTDAGKVNGISGNVDMNWSYCDFATLISGKKVSAAAIEVGAVIDSKEPACNIVVNGRNLDAKGFIRNNHSYLPVRALGNSAGVAVGFESGKATLGKGVLDTTEVIAGTGYAQAREIAQVLGYLVEWDGETRTVKLDKGKR